MNIKVDRDYISYILDDVKSGKISVPEFQRDFVWSTKQIIDLFDSILKGYPIGSLILWKPESLSFSCLNNLGGLDIQLSEEPDRLYVLDGRQRLTALLSSLYPGGEYYDRICIDLNEMQILNIPQGRSHKLNILGLGKAFDTYSLVEYIDNVRQSNLTETEKMELANKAKHVNRVLVSYELGYISVIGGNIDDAVEVFSRLNSKTTKISSDYMLQALAYSPDSDFLFANEITEIKSRLKRYNFEGIDRELILKCVYNYLDIPFIDGKEQLILAHKDMLPEIMQNVAADVDFAVEFLYRHCGLIDCRMLPYTYQFIMLALFFRYNRNPEPERINELVRWFFYTTYAGYFTNTSLAAIRRDINRFKDYSQGRAEVPLDYGTLDFDLELPQTLRLSAVRTCAMAAVMILKGGGNLELGSYLDLFVLPETGEKTWGNTFFLSRSGESDKLLSYLNGTDPWDEQYGKYALSEELLALYRSQEMDRFVALRTSMMLGFESDYLRSIGLEIIR